MTQHDELRALVEKWRTEAIERGRTRYTENWDYARHIDNCANELEAILSAPVEVAEAQAVAWRFVFVDKTKSSWHDIILEPPPQRGWFEYAYPPIAASNTQADGLQAKIDELMLEYCPDEMTPEQIENWGKHQVRCSPEEEAAINKSIGLPQQRAGSEEGEG